MPYSKSNLLKRRFGCFLDVPTLKNLAAELINDTSGKSTEHFGGFNAWFHSQVLLIFVFFTLWNPSSYRSVKKKEHLVKKFHNERANRVNFCTCCLPFFFPTIPLCTTLGF